MQRFPERVLTAGATLLALVIVSAVAAALVPRSWAGQQGITATGPLVVLSPATGKIAAAAPAFAPTGATVRAILPDGRGGWWVGGGFTQVGGFHCPNLVHLMANLGVDQKSCPYANGLVFHLTASGSTLFVSGEFSRMGGARRTYLAAIDERTGGVLPWNPQPYGGYNGGPDSLIAAQGSTVYVAGGFERLGGKARLWLGAVDARTGRATEWNPRPDGTVHGESVYDLAPAGRAVFVDGLFTHIGGAHVSFAALDAKTGKAIPFQPYASDPVVANGKLYVQLLRGSAAFDLPSLVRDRRWAPPPSRTSFRPIFAVDSQFAYTSDDASSTRHQNRQRLVALDPTTGALRWRSPVFSATVFEILTFTVGSAPTYVLVGGTFQRVQN